MDPDSEEIRAFSFSGDERNRLFMNREGKFIDKTLLSGVDDRTDGRACVMADFDKDGLLEIGIVSLQHPRFRIVKLNRDHQKSEKQSSDSGHENGFVEIRLIGRNQTNSSSEHSPRDPVGAILKVKMGSRLRMFQLTAGQGFAVQNSRAIHIGLGAEPQIDELEIHWPSGKISTRENVTGNSRITVRE